MIFIRNSELEQKRSDSTILFSWVAGRLVPCNENRGANRDGQHRDDKDKRNVIRDGKELGQNHLNSNKNENYGEAAPKLNKAIHQTGQQKAEGAQSENRAKVRAIDDKGVTGSSEDGRNATHG